MRSYSDFHSGGLQIGDKRVSTNGYELKLSEACCHQDGHAITFSREEAVKLIEFIQTALRDQKVS